MIKKLGLLAAAGFLAIAATATTPAPASAEVTVIRQGGMHRDHGWRGGRAHMMRRDYGMRRHGWDRGRGSKTVIIRR